LTDQNDLSLILNACSESLAAIYTFLPLLGFILRSTNVRNSFEVFGPLRRLARRVLGEKTKLILSSEWMLSPHVYSPLADLPEFVLLGLPASESGNPLLISVAGHELGHTTWKSHHIEVNYWPTKIDELVLAETKKREKEYEQWFGAHADDLFFKQDVSPACVSALRQLEETFCDCVGVRLFAESYLHAFASLILPSVSAKRSFLYPSAKQRFLNLKAASQKYGVTFSDDYDEWFSTETVSAKGSKEQFLLSLADSAVAVLVPDVLAKAEEITNAADVPKVDTEKVKRSLESFRHFVPVTGAGSLVNILTAGWQVYRDPTFWQDAASQPEDRIVTLYELILKSIEVFEIETVLSG
jgi:hypothetical protein